MKSTRARVTTPYASIRAGALVLSLAVASLTSCGGDGEGPSFPRAKTLGTLTPAEQAQVCDEFNGRQGGYGRTVVCSDGHTEHTDPDRTSCVAASPAPGQACSDLTVGSLLDCAQGVGTDLCTFGIVPACQPVRACIGA